MNPNLKHSFEVAVLVTLCAPLLQSQSVLNEARSSLFSSSPFARGILEEIKQNCPGFALTLMSDMSLPKATQLRTLDSGKYVGAVNIRRMDLKTESLETAIAGLYHLIHMDKVQHKSVSMQSWVAFQNRIREELRKSDPVRFGHLKKQHTTPGLLIGR